MKTIIKYQNIFDKPISSNQAANMKDYSKLIFEGYELKKKMIYSEGKLSSTIYFLSPGENYIDVLNDIGRNTRTIFRSNKQIINGYSVWDSRSYDENDFPLNSFSKVVYDEYGNEICLQVYDTINSLPKGGFKTFYIGGFDIINDDEIEGKFDEGARISFRFNIDGSLDKIEPIVGWLDDSYTSLSRFLQIEGGGPLLYHMTPEMLAYFTKREPLVPNF